MSTEWVAVFVVLGAAMGVFVVKQLLYFTNHPTYRQRHLKCLVRYQSAHERASTASPAAASPEKP